MPCPVSLNDVGGAFFLESGTVVEVSSEDKRSAFVGRYLVERLRTATGWTLHDGHDGRANRASSIIRLSLLKHPEAKLGNEGYRLAMTPRRVEASANTAQGLFYGLQSLLQLMPPEIESRHPVNGVDWLIPCVDICDYPRFRWRGLMLDVSRHFFPKEDVLDYIDQMARYKFNVFHIHLTDDQGWRLEIKRYPKLTAVGAWRVPRTGIWWTFDPPRPGEKPVCGGFYTQKDMGEIV